MTDTSLVFNVLAKDKASKVFGSIKGKAAIAGVAIGAALAAGVAKALAKGKSDAVLAAQLGASPAQATALGKATGILYAKGLTESVETAGASIKAAVQNQLVDPDASAKAIATVGGQVGQLALILEEDASRVSASVSQMLRTGMAQSATEAFDILTAAATKGVNKSQDLLDTVNEYGTQFRALGLDGTRSMGLLSQAIQAGARDADTAADALKEFAIRAIDGSKASAEGFAALGLDARAMTAQIARGGPEAAAGLDTVLDRLRAMKDPVQQNAAAVALFGTKAEDLAQSLFAMDPSTAVDGLGQVAGASDRAAEALKTPAQRLEAFKRKAEMALVDTIGKAIPHLEKAWDFLQRYQAIVVPLVGTLGTFAGVIYGIITAMKIWTAVQTAWGIVMAISLGPITLIVLGIAAVVAVVVLIATKTTWFQTIWRVSWGAIKGAAAAVWDWITGTLWPGMKATFIKIAEVVTWPTRTAISWGVKLFNWFKSFPGKVKSAFRDVAVIISSPFRAAFNRIASFWNGTAGRLSFRAPDWIPGLGGKGFSLPKLPMLEHGGLIRRGGAAIVADRNGRGGEVVSLPRGARVDPLPAGGGTHVVVELAGDLKKWVRATVRKDGRGSVQRTYGRRHAMA